MSETIFKYPILIAYIVKYIHDKQPDKQIGKTYIQKIVYLLAREGILDTDYSIHYYGPYSKETANELNFAENMGLIGMKWVDDKGYFISVNQDNFKEFEPILEDSEKQVVARIADQFGHFKAVELSIIATALYLKDNSKVPINQLADAVHDLKPEYSNAYIKKVLKEGGIIVG